MIEAPERSAVARRSHIPDEVGGWKVDILFIPTEDGGIARVPVEPADLLLRLAREGTYGLRLVDSEASASEGPP